MVPRYSIFPEPGCVSYGSGFWKRKSQEWAPVRLPHALSSGHSLHPLIRGWLLESQKGEELDVWKSESCVRRSDWKFLCWKLQEKE